MKKRTAKLTAVLMTAAMTATLFMGCGSTAKSDKDSASVGNTEKGTEASGKTKIEFFNQKTEIVGILKDLIKEYETKNPNVQIELTTPADSSTVLASRMASNDTPDIFTQWPNSSFFTQVDSGYVMDLSKTGIMDNIQEGARNQWKHNGGEYAATMSYNCSGIWYNKDMFTAAGITTLPTTWDELMKDCETLKAKGYVPFVTSAKETSITDRQLQVFLASSMGKSYNDFEKDAGDKKLDEKKDYSASLTSMAKKMLQVVSYSQKDTMGTDQDSATADFANGKCAMMIGGSWLLASTKTANPKINMSMMPIPGDTAEETNTCAYPGDMSLCIAKDSKVQKEAVEFVKWMTSKEIATKYAEAEGNPSCINGVDYVAPEFKDLYATYVTTGKFILNPDCSWTQSQQNAVGSAIQQLYYDSDANAFTSNLVSAFNDN